MGINIFNNFKDKFYKIGQHFTNLKSVCTGGSPFRTGENEELVAHPKENL